MVLRKLNPDEHGRTRRLWEEVFTEDTGAFLDYYYYIKTRDNQIYAVEEDGDIRSMLHLNPYTVRMEGKEFPSAYIVAVATEEAYRKRGYMGALLKKSLQDMYKQKIPFTFLMPAAEAIYTPYDFRYIYSQNVGELLPQKKSGEGREEKKTVFSDAGLWDAGEMAEFFNAHFAEHFQVCTLRDSAYYQTMILEQSSERGGVRLMREDGVLKGFYAYAREDGAEIREPIFLPGYEDAFYQSACELTGGAEGRIKVHACPEEYMTEEKPLIMARIVCLREFLEAFRVPEEVSVDCSFAVIDPLITENSRVLKVTSDEGERELHVRETEDSEGVLPVAELTEFLFGRISAGELKTREDVIISEHLEQELEKITKLTRVWLNEVV